MSQITCLCLWWNIDCVSQALLTMASPEEALRALAVMHNYAPEEYKVGLGEGNITISLSVLKLSFMPLTIMLSIMKYSFFSSRMLLVFASRSVQLESNLTPRRRNQDLQKVTSLIKPSFCESNELGSFDLLCVSCCFLRGSDFHTLPIITYSCLECLVGIITCFAIKYFDQTINLFVS